MEDIFQFECELCHKLTLVNQLKEGFCPNCQKYLIPTFLRVQPDLYKKAISPILKLIKGGEDERKDS